MSQILDLDHCTLINWHYAKLISTPNTLKFYPLTNLKFMPKGRNNVNRNC